MKKLKKYESFEPEEEWMDEPEQKPVVFYYDNYYYISMKYIDGNTMILYDNYTWKKSRIMDGIGQVPENIVTLIKNNNIYIWAVGKRERRIYYKDLPDEIRKNLSFDIKDIETDVM